MTFIITRGFKEGKNLTTAQKSSALFSEEPVVLGKVLRRGSPPLKISQERYELNKVELLSLERAGAILIQRPEEDMRQTVKPCETCGQVPGAQGGEFTCPACGLPIVFDPASLSAPNQEPVPQAEAAPVVPAPEAPVETAPALVAEVTPVADVPVSESVVVESKTSSKRKK